MVAHLPPFRSRRGIRQDGKPRWSKSEQQAFATGYQAVYQAVLLFLVGIPIYSFLKARRERLGQAVEPAELTAAQLADEFAVFTNQP